MWLLDATTQRLKWFHDEDAIKEGYAILSHTWGEEEVLLDEMRTVDSPPKNNKGYQKIEYTCRQALEDGYRYVWIDTCCIDKTSSAELSEAINSMFKWYAKARICYAFLSDVHAGGEEALEGSRWLKRGWTLQELIAPAEIKFYGEGWEFLGTKEGLSAVLEEITGIEGRFLSGEEGLKEACIAKKMSWAAGRQTTRVEDRAYSLLGLFGVNMALIYGEGDKAFKRLQEEIIKTSTDQSFLVWHLTSNFQPFDVLASSPDNFATAGDIFVSEVIPSRSFELTNAGLHITLPIIHTELHSYGLLNCRYENQNTGPIALALELPRHQRNQAESNEITIVHKIYSAEYHKLRYPILPPGYVADAVPRALMITDENLYPVDHIELANLSFMFKTDQGLEFYAARDKAEWSIGDRIFLWLPRRTIGDITWRLEEKKDRGLRLSIQEVDETWWYSVEVVPLRVVEKELVKSLRKGEFSAEISERNVFEVEGGRVVVSLSEKKIVGSSGMVFDVSYESSQGSNDSQSGKGTAKSEISTTSSGSKRSTIAERSKQVLEKFV